MLIDPPDAQEQNAVWPDLDSVISLRILIMDHIPKGCLIAWCDTLTSALEQFTSKPSMDSLALLSLVPKLILLKIDRGGRRAKRQRVQPP